MPVFVSRFSSARASVANFRALRARDDDDDDDIRTQRGRAGRQERVRGGQGDDGRTRVSRGESAVATRTLRTAGRQESVRGGEGDGTRASAGQSRNAFGLLISSQRADQISRQVSDRVRSGQGQATRTRAQRTTQASRDRTGTGFPEAPTTRPALGPALQSAVRRIDSLSRLISSRTRGNIQVDGNETAAARVRLATSLRVERTTATAAVVRTAQAARTARSAQAAPVDVSTTGANEQAQTARAPRAEDRLRETTELKQNLREDVSAVTRGLVRDSIRQNAINGQRTAQNLVAAQRQGIRAADRNQNRTSVFRTQLERPSTLSRSIFSDDEDRSSFRIPNMSGLRSALALLGSNVNILVG